DGAGGTETLTISVGEGTLSAAAGSSGALVNGGSSGTGSSLTISGTIAQINALLGSAPNGSSLAYIDNITNASTSTTLSLSINDGGNTGGGGPRPASAPSRTNAAGVTAPPTLTATPTSPTFTEGSPGSVQAAAVAMFSGASISTIENGQNITLLKFTVSGLLDGANEK